MQKYNKNNLRLLFLCNNVNLTLAVFTHLTVIVACGYYLPAEVRLQFAYLGMKTPSLWPLRVAFLFGPHEMKQITITMEDDGSITVASDEMQEPYKCKSIDECRQFLDKMLAEEAGESPEEQATEGPEDYSKMWNEEAGARKPQPGLMA